MVISVRISDEEGNLVKAYAARKRTECVPVPQKSSL